MIRALLLSSVILNAGLFLGRFSGFVRESLVATRFGATAEADVVVLMLTVPDLLVNILMGGALGAVLIPEFVQFPERAKKFLYQTILILGVLSICVVLVLYKYSLTLVTLLAPGFEIGHLEMASYAIGLVVWLMPLTILAGVCTAYLQAQNRFGVAALGTLIINTCIIIGLLFSGSANGYEALWVVALFVLFGGILRLASQLAVVGVNLSPVKSSLPLLLNRDLVVRYGQAVISGSVLLFFPVVARAFASYSGEGSLSLFNYAIRLVEFPLAIAVTFIAAVFFPRLSQSYVENPQLHERLIKYGLQITLILAVIAAACLGGASKAYVRAAFDYGGMGESDLTAVSMLTVIGLLSLPLQGTAGFLTAVFNSRKDTRTPMLINLCGLATFIAINSMQLFGQGLESLMWGMLFSYSVIVVLQICFMQIPGVRLSRVFLDWRFVVPLSVVSILLCVGNLEISLKFAAWPALFMSGLLAAVALLMMVFLHGESRAVMLKKLGFQS